jgi:two-component system NtrC family sensor kinase
VFRPDSEFHIARTDGELVLCEGETNLIRWHQESVLQVKVRRLADREKLHQVMRRAEKMSALGRLVAGVAHELNNPLAVVMGYAQLMVKQQNLDETTRQEVRRILHEAERASKIVVDLLSFARPTEPQMVVVDLNQIVQNLLEVREPDLAKHNIQLLARLSPTLPRTKADPFQVEQVLSNLVTNAIHALSEHPGERTLEVDTEVDGFFIRVTVADSGPGIPPNLLEKIFEPFFTTKAPGKGTGLGLPISRSILEEHHGRLRAESEPGQGARFIIELPVISCADAVEVPQAVAALVNEEDEQPAASSGPKQVLIVDDEPGILEVLQAVLAGNGCVVATATTGTEAWNRIRAGGIDLVISDVNIPGLTGEQLFQQVRTALPALGRRFIFLTGDTLTPAARGFLEKSGARWFAKPFNIRDVERAVDNLLHPEPVAAILGTAHHLK